MCMQANLDLSVLSELPKLTEKVTLGIQPLAPLSMVSEMPGSYYKSMRFPNQKMICGLFENILGWHIDLPLRISIFKAYKSIRETQGLETVNYVSGSTYLPLLMDYFSIVGKPGIKLQRYCIYKDLWSRNYRRENAFVHLDGSRNLDINIITEKNNLYEDLLYKIKNKELDKLGVNSKKEAWIKKHMGGIPFFYTTPTSREFIVMEGSFEFSLLIDNRLLRLLHDHLSCNNIGYLGTSEGWVNITLE